MAVQAQYPSDLLPLNRNAQEKKNRLGGDYSVQQQTNGYPNHSALLCANGVPGNARKRGRETVVAAETAINMFSVQSQPPPTLIDLAQLHNQQTCLVSTGLRLSLEDQQQRQHHAGTPNSSSSSFASSLVTEELAKEIKRQQDEIDQLLKTQGEQLRRTLAERRQRQDRLLLSAVEESAMRTLREKEAEVERVMMLNMQLEERVAQLKAEVQVWQTKARAQEVAAASLQTQIQQAMISGAAQEKREETARGGDADDAESAYVDPDRVAIVGPLCKACRRRSVSVVVLPCRHFCLCPTCDDGVAACPICQTPRSASVQVFLS